LEEKKGTSFQRKKKKERKLESPAPSPWEKKSNTEKERWVPGRKAKAVP